MYLCPRDKVEAVRTASGAKACPRCYLLFNANTWINMPTKPTSLAAFYEIRDRGLLPKARFKVYELLVQCGPMTKGEVNHHLGSGNGNPSYHRRVAELVDLGLVRYVRDRACSISGRICEEFEAIPDTLPKAPKTRPTKKVKLHKETLEACANFIATWHISKGGFTELAWRIKHLGDKDNQS